MLVGPPDRVTVPAKTLTQMVLDNRYETDDQVMVPHYFTPRHGYEIDVQLVEFEHYNTFVDFELYLFMLEQDGFWAATPKELLALNAYYEEHFPGHGPVLPVYACGCSMKGKHGEGRFFRIQVDLERGLKRIDTLPVQTRLSRGVFAVVRREQVRNRFPE